MTQAEQHTWWVWSLVCQSEPVFFSIQVALNDVEVSIENIQKLTKELQVCCVGVGVGVGVWVWGCVGVSL